MTKLSQDKTPSTQGELERHRLAYALVSKNTLTHGSTNITQYAATLAAAAGHFKALGSEVIYAMRQVGYLRS